MGKRVAGWNQCIGGRKSALWFAKTSAGTKNRAVLGRVGLNTIIARYGMKTKTLKGTNPSARGAHIYKGPAESRSGLGGSIVTMVQPADSLLGKNPT
jgi:hypothetical protein